MNFSMNPWQCRKALDMISFTAGLTQVKIERYAPLSCSWPNSAFGVLQERLICNAERLRSYGQSRHAHTSDSDMLTLSMNSDIKILAHLWNATRTGEWYCSAQLDGPSPGNSVSFDRVSTGDFVGID